MAADNSPRRQNSASEEPLPEDGFGLYNDGRSEGDLMSSGLKGPNSAGRAFSGAAEVDGTA